MEFLCEFDFEIKHEKGKEKKVTNALSKKFHVAAISVCKSYFRERVLEALDSDEFYSQVKEELREKHINEKYESYQLAEDGLLLHQNRIYIPGITCNMGSNMNHDRHCDSARDRYLSRTYLRRVALDELHRTPYSVQPSY